jgi:hypothetical protein
MLIEIVVRWEDGDGMEQEVLRTANSFAAARDALGSLERYLDALEVKAQDVEDVPF